MTFWLPRCIASLSLLFLILPISARHYDASYPVANSVNTFGAQILEEYRRNIDGNSSLVFSPLNLATTFQLLYHGARGQTRKQINNLFNFTDPDVENSLRSKSRSLARRGVAKMAYRVYIDKGINLREAYLAQVGVSNIQSVDFANNPESVRTQINDWVNKKTKGLIPKIMNKGLIKETTLMTLINALHFKGSWKTPFDKNLTKMEVFKGVQGKQQVPFMMLKDQFLVFKQVPKLGGVLFEIPYQEDRFGLYVFLPNKQSGWKRAEKRFSNYAGYIFDTDFSNQKIGTLKLPKWEMEFTFEDLESILKNLGLIEIFTNKGNLSGMSDNTDLALTTIIHKSKITVEEKGTEAAAASISIVNRSAADINPVNLTVDHPFLYFVLDKSDRTVLFQGTQTSFPVPS